MGMTVLLTARPEAQNELAQTLRGLASALERQPGCTTCALAQDVAGGPRFLLHLGWTDLQAMRAGMGSEPFRVLAGATSTLSAPGSLAFLPSMNLHEVRALTGADPLSPRPSHHPPFHEDPHA